MTLVEDAEKINYKIRMKAEKFLHSGTPLKADWSLVDFNTELKKILNGGNVTRLLTWDH
jgi:hypothetical protein